MTLVKKGAMDGASLRHCVIVPGRVLATHLSRGQQHVVIVNMHIYGVASERGITAVTAEEVVLAVAKYVADYVDCLVLLVGDMNFQENGDQLYEAGGNVSIARASTVSRLFCHEFGYRDKVGMAQAV